jgi:hypothetical protein
VEQLSSGLTSNDKPNTDWFCYIYLGTEATASGYDGTSIYLGENSFISIPHTNSHLNPYKLYWNGTTWQCDEQNLS